MLILLTVGAARLALFVIIELEVDQPLLDVRVFRYWPFTNSLLLISVLSIGLFAVLFYIPLFLQQAQGLGAFEAGLLLLPQALVMARADADRRPALRQDRPALAGRDRAGDRRARHLRCCTDITLDMTDGRTIVAAGLLRAAGMGLAMMPIMTGGISAIPPAAGQPAASAFNNVVQRTPAALGLAVLTAMA